MKIAIITGASSGLGLEFARLLPAAFPQVERVWLVARRADRLESIAAKLGVPAEAVTADLCSMDDIAALSARLGRELPEVAVLVNCAGCGYLGNVDSTDPALLTRSIDLNVRALTAVTCAVLPHMKRGAHIINISSIASFCPNARLTVYSATKSYVTDFSFGLREELLPRGITVTAVCPGPMNTEFLSVGKIAGNSKMFSSLPYCDPASVAAGAMAAAKRGAAVWTPKAFFKFYRFIAKIMPHKLLVKLVRT